jgi:hypothetical protein
VRSGDGVKEDDINRKFECLVRKGVFRSVARFIRNDTEERLEEGIAQTFELYRQHALRGVELAVPVLVCVCRRRAVDLSRHLVKGQHSLKDPLDPRAFHQSRVELVHLDGLPGEDAELGPDGDRDLEATIFDRETANRTSALISTISLGEWLEKLTNTDLMLVTRRLEGYTLTEISNEAGKSITVTCQRLRLLGQDLAQHAQLPVPKRARKPRTSKVPFHMAAA